MEFFWNSPIDLSDIEFKYIPKASFEKVIRKVQKERMARNGFNPWEGMSRMEEVLDVSAHIGRFISKEELESGDYVDSDDGDVTPEELEELEKLRKICDEKDSKKSSSPPQKSRNQKPSKVEGKARKKKPEIIRRDSFHIVEEVNVCQQPNQRQQKTLEMSNEDDDDDNDDANSGKRVESNQAKIENSNDDKTKLKVGKLIVAEQEKSTPPGQWGRHRQTFGSFIDNQFDAIDQMEEEQYKKETSELPTKQPNSANVLSANSPQYDDEDYCMMLQQEMADLEKYEASSFAQLQRELYPVNIKVYDGSERSPERKLSAQKSNGGRSNTERSSGKESAGKESIGHRSSAQESTGQKSTGHGSSEQESTEYRPRRSKNKATVKTCILQHTYEYLEKIYNSLGHISECILNPIAYCDISEVNLRKKRMAEYTARFTRNHLYQIGRATEAMRESNVEDPHKFVEYVDKLYCVILQAVQQYAKNIDSFIINRSPDKLIVLVNYILYATKACFDRQVFDQSDGLVRMMTKRCVKMCEHLKKFENEEVYAPLDIGNTRRAGAIGNGNIRNYARQMTQKTMETDFIEAERDMSEYSAKGSKPKDYDFFDCYDGYGDQPKPKPPSPYDTGSIKPTRKPSAYLEHKRSPYDMPKSQYSVPNMRAKPKPSSSYRSSGKSGHASIKSSRQGAKPAVNHIQQNIKRISSKDKIPAKANGSPRSNKPVIKKTDSEISTAVQKDLEQEKSPPAATQQPINDVQKLMEMIKSITKDKFNELLSPILSQLAVNEQETKENVSRVTADVEPIKPTESDKKRPNSRETVERIANNIQCLFVESLSDQESENELQKSPKAPEPKSKSNKKEIGKKSPVSVDDTKKATDKGDEGMKINIEELRKQAMKDRFAVVEKMSKNPLYNNKLSKEPWKLLSQISDQILNDMLESVMKEFGVYDDDVVKNFVKCELAY